MLKMIDDAIHLTRGDTAELSLCIMINDEEEYTMTDDDTCVLTVRKNALEEDYVFQVECSEGKFKIEPEDTTELKFGKYKYDVQLTLANGDIHTVCPVNDFIVEQEVTL